MTLEEYCISKKIDLALFRLNEPSRVMEWEMLFKEVSVNSFTQQKLFLINDTRRKYKLKIIPLATEIVTPPVSISPKPVFKPKMGNA